MKTIGKKATCIRSVCRNSNFDSNKFYNIPQKIITLSPIWIAQSNVHPTVVSRVLRSKFQIPQKQHRFDTKKAFKMLACKFLGFSSLMWCTHGCRKPHFYGIIREVIFRPWKGVWSLLLGRPNVNDIWHTAKVLWTLCICARFAEHCCLLSTAALYSSCYEKKKKGGWRRQQLLPSTCANVVRCDEAETAPVRSLPHVCHHIVSERRNARILAVLLESNG